MESHTVKPPCESVCVYENIRVTKGSHNPYLITNNSGTLDVVITIILIFSEPFVSFTSDESSQIKEGGDNFKVDLQPVI